MLLELDGNILLWIQDFVRNDALTVFFRAVTKVGNAGIFWILLTILLLAVKKTRYVGANCFFALVFTFLLNNLLLKNLVGRIRPYEVIDGLTPLIDKPIDASFPSGHTANGMAVAFVCLRLLPKKAGIPIFILAVLIAISRLYLGVHYPSDVICGAAIGIIMGYPAKLLTDYIYAKKEETV